MRSALFLSDLRTSHEPAGGGVTTWPFNAKGERREGARGAPRTLRAFASFALCVKRPVHGKGADSLSRRTEERR